MQRIIILLPLILTLIVNYSLKRRFLEFNSLVRRSKSNKSHFKFSFVEVVNYCKYVFRILKIKSCLTKSLVINDLLLKCGYEPEIHIGVNKDSETIKSHCWVFIEDHYTEDKIVRDEFKLITKI